jgi:DNA-binding transcriptional MerR regulator
MDEKELISKKELLQLTGISYGQLYRWKRENLIPEDWFIKQSSFTGQETYFPKDKMLKRINTILELKDKYSLEELAAVFSPDTRSRSFHSPELLQVKDIQKDILELFKHILSKEYFSFVEVQSMVVLGTIGDELQRAGVALEDMIRSLARWAPELKNIPYRLVLCRKKGEVFFLLLPQGAQLLLEHTVEEVKTFYLDDILEDFNLRFNNRMGVE